MRENRTYGSEGGETGKPVFPTPIEEAPCLRVPRSLRGVTFVRRIQTGEHSGLGDACWKATARGYDSQEIKP
jgi:hypothetical protein